ncbi:MAG: type I-U CRISPR-associated helicase/endonuclease Cas3, partial [Bacteroidetes bacterium]|nr:type I-U CRISPR-associated helicase/endonuclease Cas3 [Bacteroidota bacterium]
MAISLRMPTFNDFYRAINQREPFPWQSRLAAHVASTGKWYPEIGIPTGLGKTACLDIAVWWLASQADRAPIDRIAPTRIWWVVNRRLLVDSTFEHAKYISEILNNPKSTNPKISQENQEIITDIADRLRSISCDPKSEPIQVIRLRGGVASQRPSSPSQPAIILSTLPMYGSRLLFRGYGSSRGMRSIDAAMAGTDSLILLDEAHLIPHLRSLLSAIADCTTNTIAIPNKSRAVPRLVQLTATGDQSDENRFTLNKEDEENSIVKQRLDAVKLLDLRVMSKKNENTLADAARDVLQYACAPASCIVFVNTPKTARKVFSRLRKLMKNDEILLLTGRTREREAELIRKRILHPDHGILASSDNQNRRTQHLIIVATQTLEVGADVDAEYIVTEQCGVRALIQRLGRLNRFGRFKNATAVYVHYPSSKVGDWVVYGSEPGDLLQILQGLENGFRKVNLSPRHVSGYLGSPKDTSGRAPELLPGILWEWTKTFFPPRGEAPVEPYFSGVSGSRKFVTVIWRAHVPQGNGLRLWPRISDLEAIDVPIKEIREALKDDLDGSEIFRLNSDGITVEKTSNLRPGDQIILPTDRGLMDEFGWNPDATDPVMDVSLIKHGLPLDAEAIQRICGISASKKLLDIVLGKFDDDIEIDPQEQITKIDEILHSISQKCAHGWNPEEW